MKRFPLPVPRATAPIAGVTVGAAARRIPPVPRPVVRRRRPPPLDVEGKSWVLMDYNTGRSSPRRTDVQLSRPHHQDDDRLRRVRGIGNGRSATDPVTISENAWRGGGAAPTARIAPKLNSQVPLKDLLYGMIISRRRRDRVRTHRGSNGLREPMNAYAK